MLKTKEFRGTINTPYIEDDINKFLKDLTAEQVLDMKYNSNIVNYKKADGSSDIIVLTSALILYDEE